MGKRNNAASVQKILLDNVLNLEGILMQRTKKGTVEFSINHRILITTTD